MEISIFLFEKVHLKKSYVISLLRPHGVNRLHPLQKYRQLSNISRTIVGN